MPTGSLFGTIWSGSAANGEGGKRPSRGSASTLATAAAVAGGIAEIVQYGLDENYWNTYAEEVRRTTIPRITRAAQNVVVPDATVWVVVGDRAKIEAGIRELELGPVVILDPSGRILSGAQAAATP